MYSIIQYHNGEYGTFQVLVCLTVTSPASLLTSLPSEMTIALILECLLTIHVSINKETEYIFVTLYRLFNLYKIGQLISYKLWKWCAIEDAGLIHVLAVAKIDVIDVGVIVPKII